MAMMEVGQAFQHIAFRSGNGLYSGTHQCVNILIIMEQYNLQKACFYLSQEFLYHLTKQMRDYMK